MCYFISKPTMLSGTTSKAAMKRMHRTHTCRRSVHFRLLRRETVGLVIGANQNTCTVVLCFLVFAPTTLTQLSLPHQEKHDSPLTNIQWVKKYVDQLCRFRRNTNHRTPMCSGLLFLNRNDQNMTRAYVCVHTFEKAHVMIEHGFFVDHGQALQC